MVEQEQYPQDPISYEIALKLRDLESSNRLTKERTLLIGQNLIELQEKNNKEITQLKKQVIELTSDLKRIKSIVESMSEEIAKSARKEEVAILSRQFKMFQPLKYARIEDIEKLIDKKTAHKIEKDEHGFWRGKL